MLRIICGLTTTSCVQATLTYTRRTFTGQTGLRKTTMNLTSTQMNLKLLRLSFKEILDKIKEEREGSFSSFALYYLLEISGGYFNVKIFCWQKIFVCVNFFLFGKFFYLEKFFCLRNFFNHSPIF